MIFFGGRDAGIVGGYGLINPPFLVVPGAVAIEQILSIVHVNHAVFFFRIVIAWKPNIYVSGGHESGGEIMMSVDATLTWCCVGRSNEGGGLIRLNGKRLYGWDFCGIVTGDFSIDRIDARHNV